LQAAFRRAEAELQRRIDLRDFNDELAGLDIRAPRFHSAEFIEERRDARSGRRGSSAQREYANFLQMLLATNAAYARLYNDTLSLLRDAEAATERAISKAQQALDEARATLEQTLGRAATLPDGTRVFRDARGQVSTEHGQRVSDPDASGIEWRGDEPGYERFKAESEAVTDRRTSLEELQGYSVNTLGRIRDRMMDQHNPASAEQIQQFKQDLQEKMPVDAQVEFTAPGASIAPGETASTGFVIPQLPPST
jgi:hypothetical protein